MHLGVFLSVLSLVGVSSARFGVLGNAPEKIANSNTKRFILEVSKGSDLARLTSELASCKDAKLYKTFESEIFTGVSIETSIENADSLRILESVGNVWQSRMVQMASVMKGQVFSEPNLAVNYSIHSMTGVDKLHEAGILGKGVKIAVVDAGIDYTHPALGAGFGAGFKVIGGYDLVGNSSWPEEGFEKIPDDDPYEDDPLGHGTHVSGIIAGKTDSWQGVAPEASILAYKVFNGETTGSTDEETLIEAFLRAHFDGADIVTSSIGGRGGFSDNAWAEIASRLVDQGVVVTISAGNDGTSGIFFADNGMSGKNVLAIASVEPSSVPGMPFEVAFESETEINNTRIGFFQASLSHPFPTNSSGLPIVVFSTDPKNLTVGCSMIQGDIPDLSGTVVLAPRGGCSSFIKRYNIRSAGADNVMLFNNNDLFPMPDTIESMATDGIIGHEDGVAILQAIEDGLTVTARFRNTTTAEVVNMDNPAVVSSYFTSLGGLYDLQIKPDIAAPGSNIFSTLPHKQFGVMSGTSMATPYVAGIAALYISKYGGRWKHGPEFGKRLASRIRASGNSIPWNDGNNLTDYNTWAPIFQLGNGLVNATKVLDYRTELSFTKFALNDTANFQSCQRVNITNNCTRPITYKFSLEAAGGYEGFGIYPEISSGPGSMPFVPMDMNPKVQFPEGKFTVEPGETKEATFHFEAPKDLNETALPVYSGRILITGSNKEELAVPYMGVGADIQKTFQDMFVEDYPYILSTNNYTRLEDKSTFTFNLSLAAQDFPKLHLRLRWGAPAVRWDIFEAGWQEESWKYPPVPGKNGFVGMAATWNNDRFALSFDPDMHNEMDLIRGPIPEISRDVFGYFPAWRAWWLGRLADGSKIKPGNYLMRIAVLTPFGDATRSDHWDIYSHDFRVAGSNTTFGLPTLKSKHRSFYAGRQH